MQLAHTLPSYRVERLRYQLENLPRRRIRLQGRGRGDARSAPVYQVYLCRRSHCARTYCKYRQLLSPTVSAIAADCDIPRPGSGRSFVAETSYEPSSVNAHSSHSTNHRSNAIVRSLENDSPFLCPLTLSFLLVLRSLSRLTPEVSSTMCSLPCVFVPTIQ